VAILSAVTGLVAVAMAAPPEINVPEPERNGTLSAASVDQVKALIAFYTDEIRNARNDQDAVKAREQLMEAGYRKYDAVPYQFEFAKAYAAVAAPLLRNAAPKAPGAVNADAATLNACKQINLAMAAAQMPRTSIQDLLDVMVAHPNAGVRFYGWKGYAAVMQEIVGQPKAFMASLAARAPREQSPQVIAAMVRAMVMERAPDQAAAAEPRKQAAKILAANWDKWCGAVMAGNADMAAAACDMVQSVAMIDRTIGKAEKDVHTDILQALVDMAVAAAKAYADANADEKNIKTAVSDADKILLSCCEDALNSVSERGKSSIQTALKGDPKAEAFFANVKMAAYGWKDDLKSAGVRDPDIPIPATQPTTAP
jgi:hypothetical protein